MTARNTPFPGYNVLDKIATPSWDDATRTVIDSRMSARLVPRFFTSDEWQTIEALCACVIPQASANPEVPLPAMLDAMLFAGIKDGYRNTQMPSPDRAWRIGLAALDDEASRQSGSRFAALAHDAQHALLEAMQSGNLTSSAWQHMPPALFFSARILHDICGAYYSHPHAWSEIGFGGPANPRGYVRLYFNRRDPWEAAEVKNGDIQAARKENARVR